MWHKSLSCQEANVFSNLLIQNWVLYVRCKKAVDIPKVCCLKCYHLLLQQRRGHYRLLFHGNVRVKFSCPKICSVSQPLPYYTQQFPKSLAVLWVLMFTNLQLPWTSHGNGEGKLPKCERISENIQLQTFTRLSIAQPLTYYPHGLQAMAGCPWPGCWFAT